MAVVYEGVHPGLGRSVAIKMLSHSHVYHPHFADRFRNEARIIAKLRHPNICRYRHHFTDGAKLCIPPQQCPREDARDQRLSVSLELEARHFGGYPCERTPRGEVETAWQPKQTLVNGPHLVHAGWVDVMALELKP